MITVDAGETIYMQQLTDRIHVGLDWTVFEANNVMLWNKITVCIESILFNDWKNGKLVGAKPDDAYFITCDRSIMSSDELDSGRGHCVVGIALEKPCEFVILNVPFITGNMVNSNT